MADSLRQIERRDASPHATRHPLSLLREIEASASEPAVWKAQLMRCLSAGWTSRDDLCFVLPPIAAAEAARRDGFARLVVRLDGAVEVSAIDGSLDDAVATYCTEMRGGLPLQTVSIPSFAKYFAQQYLTFCGEGEIGEVATFLLTGHVVAKHVEAVLTKVLASHDAAPEARAQFKLHDAARSLEDVLAKSGPRRSATLTHQAAIEHALSLYRQFFEDLYQGMRFQRMSAAFDRIQARVSLEARAELPIALYPGVGEIMCRERDDKRDIRFSVERYPCTSETLDPRVVRIPPGKRNNRHKHAHETLFYFIRGNGRILVGTTWVPVKPGDAVFAPRWAMHQTHNTGSEELMLLAITDYYLTSQVYVGKYDKI